MNLIIEREPTINSFVWITRINGVRRVHQSIRLMREYINIELAKEIERCHQRKRLCIA